MKVLFVSHTSSIGGAAKSLLSLIEGLDRAKFQPHVLIPMRGQMSRYLDAKDIPYTVSRYGRWIAQRGSLSQTIVRSAINLAGIPALLLKTESLRADVVYTNTLTTPVGVLLARRMGVPHILHAREFVQEDMGAEYILGTARSLGFLDHSTSAIICNSAAVRDKLAHYIAPEKLVVVYNGFPELDKPPENRGEGRRGGLLRLCIVGAVDARKGQTEAVKALGTLAQQGIPAELRIAGSGDARYMAAVKAEAARLGLAERVIWMGYLSDPMPLYRESHITLVCSRHEAFGRVAVEAMSVGCPVVGTYSGGLPEIITDGVTGLLYPPGNHAALASQIARLVGDPALYTAISQRGMQSVYARFTLYEYVTRIAGIIEKSVGSSSDAKLRI